jgi:rubredoxin
MSNYPAGVSGNEPEIAGYPEREVVAVVECDDGDGGCGVSSSALTTEFLIGSDEIEVQWTCPLCSFENVEFRSASDE